MLRIGSRRQSIGSRTVAAAATAVKTNNDDDYKTNEANDGDDDDDDANENKSNRASSGAAHKAGGKANARTAAKAGQRRMDEFLTKSNATRKRVVDSDEDVDDKVKPSEASPAKRTNRRK